MQAVTNNRINNNHQHHTNGISMPSIDIRKTALLNSFMNSNSGINNAGNNGNDTPISSSSSGISSSNLSSNIQSNDALSPIVTPPINLFEESFRKSINAASAVAATATTTTNSINNNVSINTSLITPPVISLSAPSPSPPLPLPHSLSAPISYNNQQQRQQSTTRSTSSYITRQPQLTSSSSSSATTTSSTQTTTTQNLLFPVGDSINLKQIQKIGKYVLFDVITLTSQNQQQQQQTQNDLMFNIALNLSDKQSYYWKKIPASDYTKKLQPYYLMDSSEYVYRFHEIIADMKDVYIFFEPHYGDLHSYMKEKKRLKESEAKTLFYQIVKVVQECHDNGVIVRDIKLKKFVFTNPEKTKISLTNLEDCLVLDDIDNDLIKSQQGCPAYVSPEVLNPSQTHYSGKLSDAWSLGIVLYTLLFGRYPFHHNIITTMFAKIAKGKFQIPTNGISLDAKILLRSLIRLNANERLLPDEILKSNWFKDFSLIDYKNIYEINKQIYDKKNSRNNNNNSNSNDFARQYLLESSYLNNNNTISNNNNILNRDEQFVPNL